MLEDVFIAWHLDQWISEAWLGPISLFVALNIVVYFHVVIGEMIPKNLAIAGPDRAALLLVPALLFVSRALRPLVRVMEWIAKGLVRLVFRVEPKNEITSAFTADEVAHIVAESHAEGLLEEEREGLVRSALDFSDKVASQVAVPVDSLVTVSFGATPADIEKLVARYGYSRFPVRTGDGEVNGVPPPQGHPVRGRRAPDAAGPAQAGSPPGHGQPERRRRRRARDDAAHRCPPRPSRRRRRRGSAVWSSSRTSSRSSWVRCRTPT